jgi:hypothetical protein
MRRATLGPNGYPARTMPSEDRAHPSPPASAPPRGLHSTGWAWWLLAAAFSPVWIDLIGHVVEGPWAGYCLVFVPLFLVELRRAPRRAPRPGLGWSVLGLALALELLLVAGGLTRAARPALTMAAFGRSWIQGRPGPRATLLLLAFVPVPTAMVSWASPELEAVVAAPGAALARALGQPAAVELYRHATELVAGDASLTLDPMDSGAPVAALLLGLLWYAGLRRGWSPVGALARGAAYALLALPVQCLAVAATLPILAAGGPARPVLDLAPWLAVALVGLPLARRRPDAPGSEGPLSSAAR